MEMVNIYKNSIDKFKLFFENIMKTAEKIKNDSKESSSKESSSLWEALLIEGNHALIKKLRYIEKEEGGFGTIVVPKKGFSPNPEINQKVLKWLKTKNVNILDVNKEVNDLKNSLKTKKEKIAQKAY